MTTNVVKFAIPLVAASFLAAMGLQQAELGKAPWYLSRAAGLVSYALLTLSVVFGLVLSTKVAKTRIPRAFAFEVTPVPQHPFGFVHRYPRWRAALRWFHRLHSC